MPLLALLSLQFLCAHLSFVRLSACTDTGLLCLINSCAPTLGHTFLFLSPFTHPRQGPSSSGSCRGSRLRGLTLIDPAPVIVYLVSCTPKLGCPSRSSPIRKLPQLLLSEHERFWSEGREDRFCLSGTRCLRLL